MQNCFSIAAGITTPVDGGLWVRPAFQYDFLNFAPVFGELASAKQVAVYFGVKSGKCDLLCAKQVALSSRVTTFQTLLTLWGQDSESDDPNLGRVRPALRKAGRILAIGL